MSKTLIKQTFAGDITVVDGQKRLTGVQITDHFEIVDVDGDTLLKQTNRSADAEELSLLLSSEVATLTAANDTLSGQNTALQDANASLTQRLGVALEALRAVAQADNDWEHSPRSQVAAVLQAEAE